MAGAVTILHNPRCSTSRAAVEAAEATGREVRVRNYLKEPLSAKEIVAVMETVDAEPTELVRRDKRFKELGLTEADVQDPEEIAELLVEHPELLQRPILIRHDLDENRAIIGRPKERTAAFLAEVGPTFPTKPWPDPDRKDDDGAPKRRTTNLDPL